MRLNPMAALTPANLLRYGNDIHVSMPNETATFIAGNTSIQHGLEKGVGTLVEAVPQVKGVTTVASQKALETVLAAVAPVGTDSTEAADRQRLQQPPIFNYTLIKQQENATYSIMPDYGMDMILGDIQTLVERRDLLKNELSELVELLTKIFGTNSTFTEKYIKKAQLEFPLLQTTESYSKVARELIASEMFANEKSFLFNRQSWMPNTLVKETRGVSEAAPFADAHSTLKTFEDQLKPSV